MGEKKQYKAVFLDWDDTIGDWQSSEVRAIDTLYERHHFADHYSDFNDFYVPYHTHNLMLWDKYSRSEVTKEFLSHDRFLFPILYANKQEIPNKDELADRLSKEFLDLTTEYFRLLPRAEETVRYLASRYPLTIVSNGFTEVQYKKIEKSGLGPCLKYVVLSEEVGAQKPSPIIFERALELNGVKKEEAVMIGDGYAGDIEGAKRMGIDQIFVSKEFDSAQTATHKVHALSDVMDIL